MEGKEGTIICINRTDIITARATFRCKKGHQWETRLERIIKDKSWCRWCAQDLKKPSLENLHKKATEKGGKLISTQYVNSKYKYEWECKNGHRFKTNWNNVNTGKWCKQCQFSTLDEFQKIAKSKEGKCLSAIYVNSRTKLKFQCKFEHTWSAWPGHIKQGTWCPDCNEYISETTCRKILEFIYKKPFPKVRPKWLQKLELDCYNEELKLALEYNGKQHYEVVPWFGGTLKEQQERDKRTIKLCQENEITILVIPYTVKYKNLYSYVLKKCPNVPEKIPKRIDYKILGLVSDKNDRLQELQEIAEKKGGYLVSDTYLNNYTDLLFNCKNDHLFWSSYSTILSGSWCPDCAWGRFRLSVDNLQEFARLNNGELLNTEYKKAKQKLRWQCLKGHEFECSPDGMKHKIYFCPRCWTKITPDSKIYLTK